MRIKSLIPLLLLVAVAQCAVIGIDFGSEFYKAVLVKPGAPFSIVENTSSQRKTENAMAFTNEERLFEKNAVSQSVSYPQTAMLRAMGLLGTEYSDETVQRLRDEFLYTNSFTKDARGLVGYQVNIPDDDQLTNIDFFIEEIIAMIFQHAKALAKKQADGAVVDVTITVPSYFTVNQRIMIKDAAELAGFNVLTLLNENTAAALMYGIDTINMQTPHTVLLVNMGASDLELSLVKYDTVKEKSKKAKEILSVHVLDEAATPSVGGHRFDVELVKILAERFDSLPERLGKESVLKDDRIVRRLMREVKRIKEILSANKSVPVKILEIADGLNLDFTLEREEFEAKISDIVKQSKFAFDKILKKYPLDQIDEVEILGGGLRVPMVKDYISELVGGKTLSTHLNPDEAMAFGSAYIAANFSSSYQVKQVYLYQSIPESIYLNITQMEGCESEDREDCFKKHLLLYDEAKNVLGQKKNINIENHIENMDLVMYTIDEDGNENTVSLKILKIIYTWLIIDFDRKS
jgi:hypoxia up-regulated 1